MTQQTTSRQLREALLDDVGLADVSLSMLCERAAATSAVLQHRALRKARNLAEQLQGALRSRVQVEQAKGILAERLHLEVGDAFEVLGAYARNQQLAQVAGALIEGDLAAEELLAEARRPRRRGSPG